MPGVLLSIQVTTQVVAWSLAVALVVHLARSPRAGRVRRAVPTVAVALLLIGWAVRADLAWWLLFPIIPATFPDGRFVPRWFVVPTAVSVLLGAVVVVTGAVPGVIVGLLQLLLTTGQIHRYMRRSTTAERESARWAVLGSLSGILGFALLWVLEGGEVAAHGPWSEGLAALAGLMFPAGFALGLLRPRVAAVDTLLRVVLMLIVAVPVLAAAFWLAVTTVRAVQPLVLRALPGAALTADTPWWAGALVVAALAAPVLRGSRWAAGQVVHRGRADAPVAAVRLGRALVAEGDTRHVPGLVVAEVSGALRSPGAELRGDPALAARRGELSDVVHEFPVLYRGEQVAVLAVSPRRGESALTATDIEVVRRMLMTAAPALHGTRAAAELADAHARTLVAREEERRRLRRDLHDDLSPSLSGIALSAAALTLRARGSDPELAGDLADLHGDVQQAVAQTREIAYDLRPAVLDDQGLVAAIRSRVHGPHADGLDLVVEASPERPSLPAAVDLAALRIVQEAVSNVRRHAAASLCTVRLRVRDDRLMLSVTDDGRGLPARVTAGIGLTSIRDRARELGGTADISTAPGGGCRVTVELPTNPGEAGAP